MTGSVYLAGACLQTSRNKEILMFFLYTVYKLRGLFFINYSTVISFSFSLTLALN